MTLKNGIPYCDECRGELVRLSEEEALNNMRPTGWTNYRTATAHYCFDCYDTMFDKWAEEVGFPACGECETFPCKRGRDCWDNRGPPLHWFPYETYFSDIVGKVENKYDERVANFARVRAMILKIVNSQPSLTVEEISKQFLLQYRFLPRIDNRLRELRAIGYIDSRLGEDCKLHWNPLL